jgi:cardiolipin synthase
VNLPNFLTLGRIIAVPVVVWLISVGRFQAAFWCFVAAGVTDAVDGYLARRLNQRTTLGAYLDPVADKALLVSIYVSLGLVGHLPSWLVILVVSRDLMIVGAVILSWLMERPVAIRPLFVSKANTAGQITLAAIVLCDLGFPMDLSWLVQVAILTVAALTLISAGAYMVQWVRHMTGGDEAAAPGG